VHTHCVCKSGIKNIPICYDCKSDKFKFIYRCSTCGKLSRTQQAYFDHKKLCFTIKKTSTFKKTSRIDMMHSKICCNKIWKTTGLLLRHRAIAHRNLEQQVEVDKKAEATGNQEQMLSKNNNSDPQQNENEEKVNENNTDNDAMVSEDGNDMAEESLSSNIDDYKADNKTNSGKSDKAADSIVTEFKRKLSF